MLGPTWSATLDAALDEISRLHVERDNALDALAELAKRYPYLEADEHFTLAALALQ